ncbi:MAG: hypothetical protein IJ679_10775 [Lachnospiraceae bacterium]|nr:hypothetical protein [Lachnospiraceae bacterium]
MAEFSVKTDVLKSDALLLSDRGTQVRNIRSSMDSIRRSLGFKIRSSRQIESRLRQLSEEIALEEERLRHMSVSLKEISDLYGRTENEVQGNAKTPSYSLEKFVKKTALAALGPFGKIIGVVDNYQKGEYGKSANDLLGFVGSVVKDRSGENVTWKDKLLDWAGVKIPSPEKMPTPKQAWGKARGKYFDFSKGNRLTAACNWAGQIASSAFDNFKEFGSVCNWRFWEETGVETLINVGEGIAIAGAVGAGFAAAGIAAPAIATGAVAAGVAFIVDKALDWGCKKVTHGTHTSWKEAVSDTISDGIDYAREKTTGFFKKLVKNPRDVVCPWATAYASSGGGW